METRQLVSAWKADKTVCFLEEFSKCTVWGNLDRKPRGLKMEVLRHCCSPESNGTTHFKHHEAAVEKMRKLPWVQPHSFDLYRCQAENTGSWRNNNATCTSLVHDLTDTDCQTQNGSVYSCIFALFLQALDIKTTQFSQKQVSVLILHLIFKCLTFVLVSFCSFIKRTTMKICMLYFVLKNSFHLNLFCVCILF